LLLSINLDHVATLRNARGEDYPSLIEAGKIVQKLGCEGITFHLREDRRHIKDQDVENLMKYFKDSLIMNFEAAMTSEMIPIILEIKPHEVCLVPEKRKELTTEGGLDLEKESISLKQTIALLQNKGIKVSLFIDPLSQNVEKAKALGADIVELHTGVYANATQPQQEQKEILAIKECVEMATKLGIQVNAGHGLYYKNLKPIAQIKGIHTFSIGFGIISRALFIGLENAIKEIQIILRDSL
jgi:pyridoxine 5-phosphate synthase